MQIKKEGKYGSSWTKQRIRTQQRDKGVCQHCHRVPSKGEAQFPIHHIEKYKHFKGDHVSANNLSNLITLCPKCHSHTEHGLIALQRTLF